MATELNDMEWASNVSESYGVPMWRVLALLWGINKHNGAVESRNIIEKGLIEREIDIYERKKQKL